MRTKTKKRNKHAAGLLRGTIPVSSSGEIIRCIKCRNFIPNWISADTGHWSLSAAMKRKLPHLCLSRQWRLWAEGFGDGRGPGPGVCSYQYGNAIWTPETTNHQNAAPQPPLDHSKGHHHVVTRVKMGRGSLCVFTVLAYIQHALSYTERHTSLPQTPQILRPSSRSFIYEPYFTSSLYKCTLCLKNWTSVTFQITATSLIPYECFSTNNNQFNHLHLIIHSLFEKRDKKLEISNYKNN